MYAECPHCNAIFRVTQKILDKADGKVRCGQCKKVFAAITEAPEENKGFLPQEAHAIEDHDDSTITFSTAPHEDPFTDPGQPAQDSGRMKLKIPDVFPADLSESLPVTYRRPRKKLRLRLPKFSSTAIAALLLAVFFTQYLTAHRQELAAYPALRPPLKLFCAITRCKIQPSKDLDKIKLLSHGVYTHPKLKDALMIKASMANRATFEQSYPIIQISLGNIKGQTIAMRRFGANEYLDNKQPHPERMPIDKPVSIQIEILDPGEKALGFEFEFL